MNRHKKLEEEKKAQEQNNVGVGVGNMVQNKFEVAFEDALQKKTIKM